MRLYSPFRSVEVSCRSRRQAGGCAKRYGSHTLNCMVYMADSACSSEGLILLSALTPSSPDIQKLVAFESAFDRIFAVIDAEGSLSNGGVTVQDCLSLLANLLRLNTSNQSYFRETGSIKNFAVLLEEVVRAESTPDGISEWARPQRDKNVWGLLAVIRLFLFKGGVGTQANQASFWQNGVLNLILEIAFRKSFDAAIRSEVILPSGNVVIGSRGD